MTCMADVYNLGGFVSRKRPLPDFAHSERYYHTALSHDPNHCPTLGYLSELYLMMGNKSGDRDGAHSMRRVWRRDVQRGAQARPPLTPPRSSPSHAKSRRHRRRSPATAAAQLG